MKEKKQNENAVILLFHIKSHVDALHLKRNDQEDKKRS